MEVIKRTWLEDIRKNVDLTQEEVAERVGIARTTYAMYEQGNRTPKVPTAKKIAGVLKFEWQLFFEDKLHDTCIKKIA